MAPVPRSSFTLRFRDPKTRSLLEVVAKRRGVSMNALAERLLERELRQEVAALRNELEVTLGLLEVYQPDEGDIEHFAHAEVTEEDPLRARMAVLSDVDPFAAVDALADAVER